MNQKKKEEVIQFLQKNQEKLAQNLDNLLEMIKKYDIPEANSFLLERKDEVDTAINTILKEIREKLVPNFELKLRQAAKEIDPQDTKYSDINKLLKKSII